jgi:hypothetical protein
MSYIGSTPTNQSFIAGTDSFNGTGSATNFTLSRFVNSTNDIQVVVNNVVQYPPNYSVSGNTLTISPAPSSGTNNVYVRYLSTTLQSITIPGGSSVVGNFGLSGNLQLLGSAQRITGDFSNATLANRVYAQTTGANTGTSFGVLPNGTADNSAYNAFANPDPTNTSFAQLRVGTGTGDVRLTSGITGTGTYLPMTFYTGGSERARIDTSGKFVVGDSTATSALLGARNPSNVPLLAAFSTASSGYTDALVLSEFRNYAPNNTTARFLYCGDNASERCVIRSNGGIANFSANNVNLSDRREKANFAPAGEWLSKICAIPVQTFNYIDQNMEEDPGLTLGVVAQDVQDVAPELVMESDWGTEEEPKMRLSIYQTDLQYALMKCIQEQQQMIETLQAEVASLKAKVGE